MTTNYFLEGGNAYRDWYDAECIAPMPVAPYPAGSIEAVQWEYGFDDAMDWQLYVQYLDD
jgi:hypothetical protein